MEHICSTGLIRVKRIGNKEKNLYEIFWDESDPKLNLHSYVVSTKNSRKRNVLMLFTMKPILGVAKEHSNQKPAVYKFYNFTKWWTDVIDQRIGFYSRKAKSRRWTMSTFAYMLDTCRVNACTVYAMNNSKDPRSQDSINFGMDLVMSLVLPFIQMRPRVGLSTAIKKNEECPWWIGRNFISIRFVQQRGSVSFPGRSKKTVWTL